MQNLRAPHLGFGGFDRSPAAMQAYAQRTVQFLSLIETTVRRLETDRAIFESIQQDARAVLADLVAGQQSGPIDPQGVASESLLQAAASALRIYNAALAKRQAARTDPGLSADDGVVDGYDRFITAVADLHNAIEELRDTLETLDAAREPAKGGAFVSADALIADMLK